MVTSDKISNPIIGYNTIEHLVKNFKDKIDLSSSLVKVIGNLSSEKAENMVNLVEKGAEICELSKEATLVNTKTIFILYFKLMLLMLFLIVNKKISIKFIILKHFKLN